MNSTLFKCVAPPQVKGVKYVWKMWRGSIYCLACSSTVLSHRFCTVFTCSVFFGNISWNSITHYRFGFRTQLKLSYSQDLLAYTISLQVVLLRVCWMDGQCQYRRTTNCTKHNNKSSNKRTMIRNKKKCAWNERWERRWKMNLFHTAESNTPNVAHNDYACSFVRSFSCCSFKFILLIFVHNLYYVYISVIPNIHSLTHSLLCECERIHKQSYIVGFLIVTFISSSLLLRSSKSKCCFYVGTNSYAWL